MPAWGWGALGHRTIAVIAATNLTLTARIFVADRLGALSMADVASWADKMTKDPRFPGSIWYHFEKFPDGERYLDNLRSLPDSQRRKGGAVAAILVASDTLRNPRAKHEARTDALKFLIHLVGDIHQPLHTGRPADKGGVNIKMEWFGEPMSLHRVWDSGLILTGHADLLPPDLSLGVASRVYADFLIRKYSRKVFATEMDVEGWLDESLAIRPYAYNLDYLRNPERYQARHLEQIDERIYVAGLRLARLLNDIAANAPVPPREFELWSQIQGVLGDPYQIIWLKPRLME